MRCPDVNYRALRRVRIERGNAQNIFILPFSNSNKMRATLAAKMANLTRRRFIALHDILTRKPPEFLASNPSGRCSRRRVGLLAGMAMAEADRGCQFVNFILDRSA